MPRPFRFDVEKTVQAVAYLLRRERGHRMNYMRLLKILYLAEREVLRESGKPLTGSRVVAMRRGPVLEDVFSLIRSQHLAIPQWSRFFQTDGYELEMTSDAGVGKLSKFVAGKLEEIAVRHEHDDEFAMVDFTHALPEWIKNNPGDSSKEIPLADILDSIGRGADFKKIVEGAREDQLAADFFAEPTANAVPAPAPV
jgi:uncharacterized phage-associated protein